MRTLFFHYDAKRWYNLILYVFALYFVTFGLLLPYTCKEWVHSSYFKKVSNRSEFIHRVTAMNELDKLKAQNYFAALDPEVIKTYYENAAKNEALNFTVAVITMEREGSEKPRYLTQTLAKLDKLIRMPSLSGEATLNMSLFICDVNTYTRRHEEQEWMETYFISQHAPKKEGPQNIFEKEKNDYIYCMEEALKIKSPYILMIEDDALPKDNIFEVLQFLLTNHNKLGQGHQELGQVSSDSKWVFLKLYYPARWRGFGFEFQHMVDLLSLGTLGGFLFLLVVKIYWRNGPKRLTKLEEVMIFLLGIFYFTIAAKTIGKPYLIELLSVSKYLYRVSNGPECCTPAVLFPAEMAADISKYLKTQTCDVKYGVDLAMEWYVKANNYNRLLVEPSLVTHIGMVSSLKGGMRFPAEFIFR